jgi:hypothetical protein
MPIEDVHVIEEDQMPINAEAHLPTDPPVQAQQDVVQNGILNLEPAPPLELEPEDVPTNPPLQEELQNCIVTLAPSQITELEDMIQIQEEHVPSNPLYEALQEEFQNATDSLAPAQIMELKTQPEQRFEVVINDNMEVFADDEDKDMSETEQNDDPTFNPEHNESGKTAFLPASEALRVYFLLCCCSSCCCCCCCCC